MTKNGVRNEAGNEAQEEAIFSSLESEQRAASSQRRGLRTRQSKKRAVTFFDSCCLLALVGMVGQGQVGQARMSQPLVWQSVEGQALVRQELVRQELFGKNSVDDCQESASTLRYIPGHPPGPNLSVAFSTALVVDSQPGTLMPQHSFAGQQSVWELSPRHGSESIHEPGLKPQRANGRRRVSTPRKAESLEKLLPGLHLLPGLSLPTSSSLGFAHSEADTGNQEEQTQAPLTEIHAQLLMAAAGGADSQEAEATQSGLGGQGARGANTKQAKSQVGRTRETASPHDQEVQQEGPPRTQQVRLDLLNATSDPHPEEALARPLGSSSGVAELLEPARRKSRPGASAAKPSPFWVSFHEELARLYAQLEERRNTASNSEAEGDAQPQAEAGHEVVDAKEASCEPQRNIPKMV